MYPPPRSGTLNSSNNHWCLRNLPDIPPLHARAPRARAARFPEAQVRARGEARAWGVPPAWDRGAPHPGCRIGEGKKKDVVDLFRCAAARVGPEGRDRRTVRHVRGDAPRRCRGRLEDRAAAEPRDTLWHAQLDELQENHGGKQGLVVVTPEGKLRVAERVGMCDDPIRRISAAAAVRGRRLVHASPATASPSLHTQRRGRACVLRSNSAYPAAAAHTHCASVLKGVSTGQGQGV
ncbi:hypothetical protein B0H12DRAFT_1078353 [Mycena haematopus]|nr:hypothetical protein B0H12DRAFT_1078353 [Mycena haematopus]